MTFEIPLFPDSGLLPAQVTPTGQTLTFDGNNLLVASATKAFWIINAIKLTSPAFVDVVPPDLGSFTIRCVAISPFFTSHVVPAYILASDGTNSAVWYTPNVAAGSVTWTKGDEVANVFTVIRCTNVAGKIEIYCPNTSTGVTPDYYLVPVDPSAWSGFPIDVVGFGAGAHRFNDLNVTGIPQPDIGSDTLYGLIVDNQAVKTFNYPSEDPANQWIDWGISDSNCAGSFSYWMPGTRDGTYQYGSSTTLDQVTYGRNIYFSHPGMTAPDAVTFATTSWPRGVGDTISAPFDLSFQSGMADLTVHYSMKVDGIYDPDGEGSITDANWIAYGLGPGANLAVTRLSSDNGGPFFGAQTIGPTPGGVGGVDIQRTGANAFAASDGKVRRATSLGGAWADYYAITGGVQAACVVVPYFTWSGAKQTTATNPDIIVGLSGPDGSSRTLLWIEGGATPGTVHDLTPVANYVFDQPNAITVSYNHHIACIGKVSSTYTLRTTTDKGSSWSNRGTLTSPTFIRGRRNDNSAAASGANKGQIFLTSGSPSTLGFSSVWASGAGSVAGLYPHNLPATDISMLEPLW